MENKLPSIHNYTITLDFVHHGACSILFRQTYIIADAGLNKTQEPQGTNSLVKGNYQRGEINKCKSTRNPRILLPNYTDIMQRTPLSLVMHKGTIKACKKNCSTLRICKYEKRIRYYQNLV